ncbi:MAG: histidine kinase [Actinomycetota bacterium]|nr:histidine kinase [Actinomycetota bacterium]
MTWARSHLLGPIALDVALAAVAAVEVVVDRQHAADEFALALFAAVAVLFRRRWPRTVLVATLPALVLGGAFLAAEIALFTVAFDAKRWIWPILGAIAVFVGQIVPFGGPPSASRWLLQVIYSSLFAAAPLFLGLLLRARGILLRQLEALQAGQQREQRLVTETALALERSHLAREMHDVVAHNVSLIALQAGALGITTSDPAVVESAKTIRTLSARTLAELRHMVDVLRAAGADRSDLAPQPTLADLPRLVEASGLPAELTVDPEVSRSADAQVERAIYRTVQEGLTNVNKHAPEAVTRVEVRCLATGILVRVANDPSVSEAVDALPAGGHGLIGLQERAELLGGSLDAHVDARGGFVLEALFPPDPRRRTRGVGKEDPEPGGAPTALHPATARR